MFAQRHGFANAIDPLEAFKNDNGEVVTIPYFFAKQVDGKLVHMVRLEKIGDDLNVPVQRAEEPFHNVRSAMGLNEGGRLYSAAELFPQQWQEYLEHGDNSHGTPLNALRIPDIVAANLLRWHVRSIENLAAVSDSMIKNMPPGTEDWRDAARKYLVDCSDADASSLVVQEKARDLVEMQKKLSEYQAAERYEAEGEGEYEKYDDDALRAYATAGNIHVDHRWGRKKLILAAYRADAMQSMVS